MRNNINDSCRMVKGRRRRKKEHRKQKRKIDTLWKNIKGLKKTRGSDTRLFPRYAKKRDDRNWAGGYQEGSPGKNRAPGSGERGARLS